ncbi:F-box/FBD/LRR-repeat protein-like protein [Tanacetum coccineum]
MHEFSLSIKGIYAVDRRLPLSLLPMHQLKDLCLLGCYLPSEPTYDGISSLTRLDLIDPVTKAVPRNYAKCGAPHKLPTTLVNLKYLCVKYWCFVDASDNFSSIAFIMRSSPNLEKLHIEMSNFMNLINPEEGSFTAESHSGILPKHLKELEITNLSNMKGELDLVKFLLAKSPALKKLKILIYYKVDKDAEFQISRMLLSSPHASLGVEITVLLLTIE